MRFRKQREHADMGEQQGFTMIEVMLVLGLTGLLLLGVLGGTFTSISSQRYNDSVRSIAEHLRRAYSETISPESLGVGNSDSQAVLGKVLFFGNDDGHKIYSVTLVGTPQPPVSSNDILIKELAGSSAKLHCAETTGLATASTENQYIIPWEAQLMKIKDTGGMDTSALAATVIIARSPITGAINTLVADENLWGSNCAAASNNITTRIQEQSAGTSTTFFEKPLGMCVKSPNAKLFREIRIAKNGRNTSAINILDVDNNLATNDGLSEHSRCQ